ncbi:MAG: class I SAM-dependent methyltransferase [Mycobacterium sp.]
MPSIDGETLTGVSATTLWTLRNRATEAERPDGAIDDAWAVRLFESIDYDWGKFGKHSQFHALRAVTFDAVTTEYLLAHPKAAVVALAEGLQTSFWRLDDAGVADDVRWYSVDLAPVMALREQLLPRTKRVVELAQSALDRSWMDRVDDRQGVFITAEGLLMYLKPDEVRALIEDCAARFRGGRMIFDSIPPWISRRTLQDQSVSNRYVVPSMPFGLSADDGVRLAHQIPGVHAARDIALQPGRGPFKLMAWPPLDRIALLRRARRAITLLEFDN